RGGVCARATGAVCDPGLRRPLRRTDAAHLARAVGLLDHRRAGRAARLELGGVPCPAERGDHPRHPLRDQVVEARHGLARRLRRHAPRRDRDVSRVRDPVLGRRLHDQPAARGHHRRQGVGRLRLRRSTARARARWPRAHARPAPLLLEERQVGTRPPAPVERRARLLGDKRLPQLRRPMAGTALLGRLTWQLAELVEVVVETPAVKTLVFDVRGWPGHRAGQHVDVRLTAEDGYQAERSYSIASAPDSTRVALTVQRLEDGEVSPYLTDELRPGEKIELRGPIGGYFVWEPSDGGPLMLVAGGSGIVPLMAMIRTRAAAGDDTETRLLYSSRSQDDVIYRDELQRLGGNGLTGARGPTGSPHPGWTW